MIYVDENLAWCLDCDLTIRLSPENIYGFGTIECPRCGNWISARKATDLSPAASVRRHSGRLSLKSFFECAARNDLFRLALPRHLADSVRLELALLRATGVVLLAVGANWVSQQLFGSASFLTFAAVIAASALKFGLLQNIVTLLLAVLASDFFFIPPVFRLSMNQETLDVALEYSMVLIVSLGLLRRKSL